jgi:hypothetical protein
MNVVAEFLHRVNTVTVPFERVPGLEITLEDVRPVRTEDGDDVLVLFAWCSPAPPELVDAFESDPDVASVERLVDDRDRALFRVVFTADATIQGMYENLPTGEATILEATETEAGILARFRFAHHDALRRYRDNLRDFGVGFDVESVYTGGDPSTAERYGLTDKQVETLRLAAAHGYFETPASVTLETLAEELGVTPQAVSKRLRNGLDRLLDRTVARDGADGGHKDVSGETR